MGAHLIDNKFFQSDKYPTTPRNCVPLKVTDKTAQDLLWEYAQRRRSVDAEFAADLETALLAAGFVAPTKPSPYRNGEEGCPLCGEESFVLRTGPGIVAEQYKAYCTSSSCANRAK